VHGALCQQKSNNNPCKYITKTAIMMKAEESEPFSLAAFKEHAKKLIRVAYE